jgi:hypothetical protein
MIKKYPFGKDTTYIFYPIDEDDNPLTPSVDAPTIYIYSDKPNRDEARNGTGTGLIETISSWTNTTDPIDGKTFTIAAISDPNPDATEDSDPYWVCINYTLQTGEQSQVYIEEFNLYRPRGHTVILDIDANNIKMIYPAISSYLTDPQIENFVEVAKEELRIKLNKLGFQWDKIKRADLLYLPCAYLTIAEASLSQIKEEGDRHQTRYDIFLDKAVNVLKNLELPYDSDDDGEFDDVAVAGTTYSVIVR